MSRFPSPTLADRIGDPVQELGDGFVRLGGEDTPFTLREGGESLENARRLHSERDESERERRGPRAPRHRDRALVHRSLHVDEQQQGHDREVEVA